MAENSQITATYLRELTNFENLCEIKRLSLCKKDLSSLSPKILSELTSLEELDLSNNNLEKLQTNGISLPSLMKINLSNNRLTTLEGFTAFPNLKDLNISNNSLIEVSEKYKLVSTCTFLQILDSKDVSMMRDAASRLDSTLLCKISEVWRQSFEDEFVQQQDGSTTELENEFVGKLKKEITCGPSMLKEYREFRLSILGKEHIQKMQLKSEYGIPRKKKCTEVNGDIEHSENKVGDQNFCVINTPSIKSCVELKKPIKETCVADAHFVVSHLLQTHSLNNNPADRRTQVWGCEFEPSLDKPGQTTSICATCGGDSVCFIDCNSGQVMKKYKQPGEIFYCIAWTTVTMDFNGNAKKTNLLAAGGQQKDIKIIEPNQLVCCEEITGLKGVLESLLFHPIHSSMLFCAASDTVTVWDIGFRRGMNIGSEHKSKLLLTLKSRTIVRSFAISPHGNTLVGACDDGCYLWKIEEMDKNEKPRTPFGKLSFPGKKTLPLDCVQCLSEKLVATKRVEDGFIGVWYSESDMVKNDFSLLYKIPWRRTETPFLKFSYISPCRVLVAGDDEGCVWIYRMKLNSDNSEIELEEENAKKNESSQVLMCPNESTRVFNQVCGNTTLDYIVAVADTNVVCMWRRISSEGDIVAPNEA